MNEFDKNKDKYDAMGKGGLDNVPPYVGGKGFLDGYGDGDTNGDGSGLAKGKGKGDGN